MKTDKMILRKFTINDAEKCMKTGQVTAGLRSF